MTDGLVFAITIGGRLRYARKKAGMTLREVEEKTGISKAKLSRMERDSADFTVRNMKRLAALYGLKLIELIE